MPIPNMQTPDQNQDAISQCIQTEMENYQKTGKIGNIHPNNPQHAQQIAAAACHNMAKQAKSQEIPTV